MVVSRRPATPPKIPNARYLSFLGSGGFADVYLYEQQIPHREVAIKVLRRGVTDAQREAFRVETNLMARMSSHPAVVPVHGAGETDDGRMYLIMEYCPPPHLGKVLRRRPLPVTQALEIGIQVAGAVESLHRQGMVHRDIKPANILLTQYESPVLTDFGLTTSIGDTQPAVGFSVPWAPPEQATGEGVAKPTVDVYSLAATIYTLLAGRAPFELEDGDNSEIAVINRVLRSPVPPLGRTDVPVELERVLATAMAKDPSQRYASVMDFAQALQFIQAENLHQRATEMTVLSARGPLVASGDSDDDATRMAVRMIDPSADEETVAAPPRIEPHQPYLNPSAPVAVPDYVQAWPGLQEGAAQASAGEAPTAKEKGAEDDAWGPVLRFTLVALVVIALVLVGVFATRGDRGKTEKPTTPPPTVPLDPGNEPEPVIGMQGTVGDDEVTFTWAQTDAQPGDIFVYYVPVIGQDAEYLTTNQPEVTVSKRSPQTCLSVQVRRKGVSKESLVVTRCENTP